MFISGCLSIDINEIMSKKNKDSGHEMFSELQERINKYYDYLYSDYFKTIKHTEDDMKGKKWYRASLNNEEYNINDLVIHREDGYMAKIYGFTQMNNGELLFYDTKDEDSTRMLKNFRLVRFKDIEPRCHFGRYGSDYILQHHNHKFRMDLLKPDNMNKNCIVIDGKEIDLPQSLIDEIKNKIQSTELPKRYVLERDKEYYNYDEHINEIVAIVPDMPNCAYINVYPSKELVEASLALAKLLVMRDRYNGDWKPDWNDLNDKYIVFFIDDTIAGTFSKNRHTLAFKSSEVGEPFVKNFRDLIEIAKPLL